MLVMPSDHAITDTAAFKAAVARAAAAAETGHLVTFGIAASRPDTGYGYIKRGQPLAGSDGAFQVAAFVEKPDRARAETYVADAAYSWNSGIFLFPVQLLLSELERLQPEMVAACRDALGKAKRDLDFLRLDRDAFAQAPSNSIDYAVMEHTRHAAVVPVEMGWSDVGTWDALWMVGAQDDAGNVTAGDVVAEDTKNSYLRAESGLLAVLGVEDLVVVATSDAVMVSRRDRAQDIKQLVARLERGNRTELISHPAGASSLGHLSLDPQRRARAGEAHHGEARRHPQPADASSPRRALGRRHRHRQGDQGQRRDDPPRE